MKKIVLTLLAIVVFAQVTLASAGYFAMGKAAFNNKDYPLANTYFIKALTENPNDANCRYYYAQTLTYLRNYKQARIEYNYVQQLSPNTQLGDYARQYIAYLDSLNPNNNSNNNNNADNKQPSGEGNYLAKAITVNGDLMTWNLDKMPIKVYIDNSIRASSNYILAAKEALSTWQNASDGMISFMFINEPQYADVTIVMKGTSQQTENQILGLTQHTNKNGYIDKVKVTLYTVGPNYKRLTAVDVYNVALHEFGHMLGIWGHSDEQSDILYALYDPRQHAEKMQLSSRDKDTVKLLYSIDKNPYATSSNSITKMLGSKESRMNTKIDQELAYIKQVPNNPIGYVNAGNTYMAMNNEAEAVTYYKKALTLNPNSKEANRALGDVYYKKNDLKNAEPYYKKLIQIEPKNPNSYCNLINLYIQDNKKQQARTYLSSLLYRNPSAKNDKNVQAILEQLNK